MGWYLYGITTADDLRDGELPDDLQGIGGSSVRLHGDGDLRFVVSATEQADVDLVETDPQRAIEAVRRHDEVLIRLAATAPVLPVRFGTVLPDDAAADALAADSDGRLLAALDHVADADEWVVRVDAPADGSRGLAEEADPGEEPRPGHAFFARKRAAVEERAAARREAATTAAELHLRLGELARASRPLDARDPETVARHAYLVDRARADDFLEVVGSLDGAGEGVAEVQGPLPAYRFVDGALA